MRWIKLIGIAVVVAGVIVGINEWLNKPAAEGAVTVAAEPSPTPTPKPNLPPPPQKPVKPAPSPTPSPGMTNVTMTGIGTSPKIPPRVDSPTTTQNSSRPAGSPSRPSGRGGGGGSGGGGSGGGGSSGGGSSGGTPTQPTAATTPSANAVYWIDSNDVRHNSTCVSYKNVRGREGTAQEGRACQMCGG